MYLSFIFKVELYVCLLKQSAYCLFVNVSILSPDGHSPDMYIELKTTFK